MMMTIHWMETQKKKTETLLNANVEIDLEVKAEKTKQ
jgi:hypothetical protein